MDLSSSFVTFEDPNLIDHIHQWNINLENITKDEIQKVLQGSLLYLDKELDIPTANEIFSLILSCFLSIPNQPTDFFEELLKQSQKNPNRVLMTATILSNLNQIDAELLKTIKSAQPFVTESYKQILSQIKKPETTELVIFKHKLPQQFQPNFVIDILLLSKLDEKAVTQLYPYILSHKNVPKGKLNQLIKNISDAKLITVFPDTILTDEDTFYLFSKKNIASIIPQMSEETFKKILPLIEAKYGQKNDLDRPLILSILPKLIKYKVKFNKMENIINSLSAADMKPIFWRYFASLNLVLTEDVSTKIKKFPIPSFALKIMPHPDSLPPEIISRGLLDAPDFATYKKVFAFESIRQNESISNKKFWIHLVTIASQIETDEEEKCLKDIMRQLSEIFMKHIKKEDMLDFFDGMIFTHFPLTNKGNVFIYQLLNNLDGSYRSFFNETSGIIFQKVIEKKVLPLPSFWSLFNFQYLKDFVDLQNPFVLYAYEFSSCRNSSFKIDKLTVHPLTDKATSNQLSKFISHKDVDYIINMKEEALSLISQALIFTTNNEKPQVLELTKETVLPFFAIAFNYLDKSMNNLLFDNADITNCLQEATKKFSSSLSKNSIEAIISNSICFTDPKIFPTETAVKILQNLFTILYNDTYSGDKSIIISFLFNISCQKLPDELNECVFKKYGLRLLQIIIKNFELINIDKYKDLKLDLAVFDQEKITSFLRNIIQDSQSSKMIADTICLLKRHCINAPEIKLRNPGNLIRVLHDKIDRKEWENVQLIGNFMKENNFEKELRRFRQIPFPEGLKIELFDDVVFDEALFDEILNDPKIETKSEPFEKMFNLMLKDKSIVSDYIIELIEKSSRNYYVGPGSILEKCLTFHQTLGDDFVNTIKRCFRLHPTENVFIRNNEFQSISNPLSRSGILILMKLFEEVSKCPNNFKAFFCLKNIACCFPFLFTEDPIKIFKTVLPTLDYFSLYFTMKNETENEEEINKIKAAVTALSFLHSTLYSVAMLDAFVPWLFQNILSFSVSQILCFILILSSLFRSPKVKKVLLSVSIKNNLLGIINKLLQNEVQEELQEVYKTTIFTLILNYFKYFNRISGTKAMFVKEFEKLEKPFTHVFQHYSTILPNMLQPLEIPTSKAKVISDFWRSINNKRSFWLEYSNSRYPSTEDKNKLIDDFKRLQDEVPVIEGLPELPSNYVNNNLKTIRYLANHNYYIYKWFIRYDRFPMLMEQAITMSTAYKEIQEACKTDDGEPNTSSGSININEYLKQESQEEFFNNLIDKEVFACHCNEKKALCSTIQTITKNGSFLSLFLEKITSKITEKKYDALSIQKLIDVIVAMSENEDFKGHFFNKCGSSLIDIVISPDLRNNSELLLDVSKVLNLFQKNLPKRTIHFIGFMLILNEQKILPEALLLCNKFTDDKLKCLLKEIQKVFNREFNNKEKSYLVLDLFFERFPAMAKEKIPKTLALLKKIVPEYKDGGYSDKNLRNFICSAFTNCCPERVKDLIIVASETNEIDFTNSTVAMTVNPLKKSSLESPTTLIKQAPLNLQATNKKFWELFEESRPVLNDILQNDDSTLEKMRFLLDYPELLRFYARSKYFRDKMRNRITNNGSFSIYVDRKNLLQTTFDKMNSKSIDDWLSSVHVNFNGEAGIDAGGLTCEWFTLIAKEILDPKNCLFAMSENKTCQPSPTSDKKDNYIEYFRFAGRIIARSLIQGQCVNAHFTRSFCRQILHRQVKLKDLEEFDKSIYDSLKTVLETDVEPLDMVFAIDDVQDGEYKSIELVEKGEEKAVTNDNKKEYVSLYVNYRLRKCIQNQICAFCEGFDSLIPHEEIDRFSPGELDLLICGMPEIDLKDLHNNISYGSPYSKDHPVIQMLFEILAGWDIENLAKFILFITGSSQVPVNGFKEYRDRGKPIKITNGGDKGRLCVAHTCFNTLDLPQYDDIDDMEAKILLSIQETEFGLG